MQHQLDKKLIAFGWVLASMITLVLASSLMRVHAQAPTSSWSISPSGTLASCAAPSAGMLTICNVAGDPANADGAYFSVNGAPYFIVSNNPPTSKWPTTINCPKFTRPNSGMSATGCTFQ